MTTMEDSRSSSKLKSQLRPQTGGDTTERWMENQEDRGEHEDRDRTANGTSDDQEDPDALLASLEAEIEEQDSIQEQDSTRKEASEQGVISSTIPTTITTFDNDSLLEADLPPHLSRESRAQNLAEEVRAARQFRTQAHPSSHHDQHSYEIRHSPIQTLSSDDEILKLTTQTQSQGRCLVHFFHPDFARCEIMDVHLERLVLRHGPNAGEGVKFARVDVRKAPFVVEKLAVRILPCLIGFIGGNVVGRLIGFDLDPTVPMKGGAGGGGEDAVRVTKGMEKLIFGWKVFEGTTRGWEDGIFSGHLGHDSNDESNEDDTNENEIRKSNGILGSRHKRRGIQDNQKGVASNNYDDDDWD